MSQLPLGCLISEQQKRLNNKNFQVTKRVVFCVKRNINSNFMQITSEKERAFKEKVSGAEQLNDITKMLKSSKIH
jgi:hypothetical protein